jgi:hypothetical protein
VHYLFLKSALFVMARRCSLTLGEGFVCLSFSLWDVLGSCMAKGTPFTFLQGLCLVRQNPRTIRPLGSRGGYLGGGPITYGLCFDSVRLDFVNFQALLLPEVWRLACCSSADFTGNCISIYLSIFVLPA